MSPMNECIDSRAFAALILDYEFLESPFDLPPYVSGRVLIDGCFKAYITGTDREDMIRKFRNNEY